MISAFLYIQEPIRLADLVAAGREFAAMHCAELQELLPEKRQINLVHEDLSDWPIFYKLISRGDYADWYLDEAEREGVPFHPQAILSMSVPFAKAGKQETLLQFASETVAFFVEQWTTVLQSDYSSHIYSRDEVLAYSHQGQFPY